MRVRIEHFGPQYFVAHTDIPYCSARGTGTTAAAALGDLIYHHPHVCGIDLVEVEPNPVPASDTDLPRECKAAWRAQ